MSVASYTRTDVKLNWFGDRTHRRNQVQLMHDILVSAKDGAKKTGILYRVQIGYKPLTALLKSAELAGFIEEIEATGIQKRWKSKPTMIWKSTNEGLAWARRVWADHELVWGAEG